MPLDIPPTLAAKPAAASTSATGAAPGLAALFDQMLTQSVARSGTQVDAVNTKTPAQASDPPTTPALPVVTRLAPVLSDLTRESTKPGATTFSVKTGALTAKKAKPHDTTAPDTPAPASTPLTVILVPNEQPTQTTENSAKAMDVTLNLSGELLSPPDAKSPSVTAQTPEETPPLPDAPSAAQAATPISGAAGSNVLVPTEASVLVPTEAGATVPVTDAAVTPQAPAVPTIPTLPAQAVLPATSEAAPPAGLTTTALPPRPRAAPVTVATETRTAEQYPLSGTSPHPAQAGVRDVVAPPLQNPAPAADNQADDEARKDTGSDTSLAGTVRSAAEAHKPMPEGHQGSQGPVRTGSQGAETVSALVAPVPKAPVTAPVTLAMMPTADRTQMLRQVSEGLQTMATRAAGSGQRQMTVQLHPRGWGQVNVSVTMTPATQADGKTTTQVVAHVVADQSAVKEALQTHQADLRQSLKEAGLNLDKLTVTVRPAEGGAQAGLGEGRRESRGGQGNPPSPTTMTNAQGGASGGSSSSFAAFAQTNQDGRGRQPVNPDQVTAGPPADSEAEAAPVLTMTGRVDTRA